MTPSEIYAEVERQQFEAFDYSEAMEANGYPMTTDRQDSVNHIANPMEYIDTDDPAVITRYQAINNVARIMYERILGDCPPSAERTLAIRKLQEARMWANAAIAFGGRQYTL